MAQDLIRANDGDYAQPVTACKAQGTAICHIEGSPCSSCAFALAKLNPDVPLCFLMAERRKNSD